MNIFMRKLLLFAVIIATTRPEAYEDAYELNESLLQKYNPLIRPLDNQTDVIKVYLTVSLSFIHSYDVKNQVLTISSWLGTFWTDERLVWNKTQFNDLREIVVDTSKIWLPDLIFLNVLGDTLDIGSGSKAVVMHDGQVLWWPGKLHSIYCKANVRKFPFDEQTCALHVSTNIHTKNKVVLLPYTDKIELYQFIPNGEWHIVDTYIWDSTELDFCVLMFSITLRRRHEYYVINIILPQFVSGFTVVVTVIVVRFHQMTSKQVKNATLARCISSCKKRGICVGVLCICRKGNCKKVIPQTSVYPNNSKIQNLVCEDESLEEITYEDVGHLIDKAFWYGYLLFTVTFNFVFTILWMT
ncbi:hypothetical protein CHS0354_007056 [Potamilus streckersoni]|uniref:Neurotransmitter-gated ion-channel ligand-binding domain-containing protein n=1 Tax=Potamilus streckersoni TaxID=2493646 RepID=A0AAE0SBD5_9BIVA|nr:hypothetical protein CHS0354_007056 [Potamilus streckersoni]